MKTLDTYRYINVENNDWSSPVEYAFREKMAASGVEVDSIYFDLADGACFEGAVSDWGKFLKQLGYNDQVLIDHAKDVFIFSSSIDSRWSYTEDSMKYYAYITFDPECEDDEQPEELSKYSPDELHDQFVDFFRSSAQELHSMLLLEFDYLVSYEAVRETLEINGIAIEE